MVGVALFGIAELLLLFGSFLALLFLSLVLFYRPGTLAKENIVNGNIVKESLLKHIIANEIFAKSGHWLLLGSFCLFGAVRVVAALTLDGRQIENAVTANGLLLSATQDLLLLGFSLLCLYQWYAHIQRQALQHGPCKSADRKWLKVLVLGFLAINGGAIPVWVSSIFIDNLIVNILLAVERYVYLGFLAVLLVVLLIRAQGFFPLEHAIELSPEPQGEPTAVPIAEAHLLPQQQLAARLIDLMEQKKPYLEPHITVERLAIKLNVSPKLLSCTINSQLHMNFFELIGTYRVEEAKTRLIDEELRQRSINEIMKSCGFNSKSVFNQAFKRAVGVTPSHYRQQHLR